MTRMLCQIKANVTLALVVLALAMRVIVPAGWMPSAMSGHATFTLCTGTGMVEAWVDEGGKIRKSLPGKGKATGEPCAFAGAGGVYITTALAAASPMPLFAAALLVIDATQVAVGQGLAAPPPPSTGPPARI
ncbi:MAG: hypothetical protein RLZZ366_512 [Pseudomonadota bacterium]|jgi:hypothetical protein